VDWIREFLTVDQMKLIIMVTVCETIDFWVCFVGKWNRNECLIIDVMRAVIVTLEVLHLVSGLNIMTKMSLFSSISVFVHYY
jgi:hypothetical protein